MTRWTFRLLNLDTGAYLGDLVDYTKVTAGFEYDAASSFSCEYPLTGRYASLLDTDLEIVGLFDGSEPRNARWVSRGLQGNAYDENGGKIAISGISMLDLFRKVVVYTPTTFTTQTPGAILKTLLLTASTRTAFGATATTATSFSNTLDSNGNAWANTLSITYSAGATYRQIIEQMVSLGLIDFEFNGRDLRVCNFGAMGVQTPTVNLSAGGHVTETPFKESTEEKANVILVEGEGGVLVERTVSGTRREETYAQQSGISNTATLNVVGDKLLAGLSVTQTMKTVKIAAGSQVLPFEDFLIGDFIIYDDGFNAPASNRVRQIALEIDNNGIDEYSCSLNDMILENDIKRALQLQALAGGVSGATIGTPDPPTVPDTLAPSAPASCSISSATYLETDGQIRAQISVTWPAVTTNADATAIADLDHYEVQYSTTSSPLLQPSQWSSSQIVPAGTVVAYFGPFAPGATVTARVAAVDHNGNKSGFTVSSPTTVVSDTTPPVAPSTPTVVTQFRGIQVTWNGLDNLGNAMAGDFDHVDLHVSTTNNFTPTTGTKTDSINTRGGVFSVQGLTYGTTYYAKLVAYDTTGNASAASAQGSATPQTLVTNDVPATFISNAMIQNAAIDDAKIASVSAGKITVGTLVADITLSSRIKTANTGARAEMNSGGFYAYDSGSTIKFSALSTGSVYMSGQLDAGSITGGVLDIPSPAVANAPGRTHIDDDGFSLVNEGTTNLCPDPSLETLTYVSAFNSAVVSNTQLTFADNRSNVYSIAAFGKTCLKVYDTAAANGYVEIKIGTGTGGLAASSTYTMSFHAGGTRIDDNWMGGGNVVYGNFADINIIERKSGGAVAVLATGVDTKVTIESPALGVETSGLPTGTDIIAATNFSYRWAKTFTTPSTAASTSTYWVRLPAPRTSGAGIESTFALCYDGVQVESKPYMTRYCDGDQTNCTWSGTINASASSRPDATSVWFPGHGDPIIRGKIHATDVYIVNSLQVGSSSPHGTNFIQMTRTSSPSVVTTTHTLMSFDQTDNTRTAIDDGQMLTGQNQFLSQVYGVYTFHAVLTFAANSTGVRLVRWVTQGSTLLAYSYMTAGINTLSAMGQQVLPGGGYYIQVQAFQNSGVTLTMPAHASATPNQAVFALII